MVSHSIINEIILFPIIIYFLKNEKKNNNFSARQTCIRSIRSKNDQLTRPALFFPFSSSFSFFLSRALNDDCNLIACSVLFIFNWFFPFLVQRPLPIRLRYFRRHIRDANLPLCAIINKAKCIFSDVSFDFFTLLNINFTRRNIYCSFEFAASLAPRRACNYNNGRVQRLNGDRRTHQSIEFDSIRLLADR